MILDVTFDGRANEAGGEQTKCKDGFRKATGVGTRTKEKNEGNLCTKKNDQR